MTFNTDPVGYINSDEYKFYKNFPQAWPGGEDYFKSLECALDIFKNNATHFYHGRSHSGTRALLKRRELYNFKELRPGLYALNLLGLDYSTVLNPEYVYQYIEYDSLVITNVCLLGLTKTNYLKLKKKPQSDIKAKVSGLIKYVVTDVLSLEECYELSLLIRIAAHYGLAPIESLPRRASIVCNNKNSNMRDSFSSRSNWYVDSFYLRTVCRHGDKLLPDYWGDLNDF